MAIPGPVEGVALPDPRGTVEIRPTAAGEGKSASEISLNVATQDLTPLVPTVAPAPWAGTYYSKRRARAEEPSHLSADSSRRSTDTIVSGLR